jgi:hypothetical protein
MTSTTWDWQKSEELKGIHHFPNLLLCHRPGFLTWLLEVDYPLLYSNRSPTASTSQETHVPSMSPTCVSLPPDFELATESTMMIPHSSMMFPVSLKNKSSQTEWAYEGKSGKKGCTLPGFP